MSVIDDLLDPIPIPRVIKISQQFENPEVEDIRSAVTDGFTSTRVLEGLESGSAVAITAGSRGITELPEVLGAVVALIREHRCDPFIVPAMGSHGGATADGQVALLEHMGISEKTVGAPIRSSMETVRLGETKSGVPVFMDAAAARAEAIILVNRIKPHVGFRGRYESGLMKMIAIGLGKQRGADACHDLGFGCMARNIEEIGLAAIGAAPILCGVGILENAYHRTASIEVLPASEIPKREPALQERAKELSPRLYFNNLDVLIIDEIGKNISGTGFDNNVVGRFHTPYASGGPDITRIAALDVTEQSNGNANGLGILDFTTRRAYEKFDFEQTYPNSLTSTVPTSVKIPMVLANDRQAVQAAIKTCNIPDKSRVRFARIRNTLSLDLIEVSANLTPEVTAHPSMRTESEPYELSFDEHGNLF